MLAFPTIHLAMTMPSIPANNAIMTIGEVADYLKVTERNIYRLTGTKQIPAFKAGEVGDFPKQILRRGSEIRMPSKRQTSCE
jgi:excisionase family DNA binding protein